MLQSCYASLLEVEPLRGHTEPSLCAVLCWTGPEGEGEQPDSSSQLKDPPVGERRTSAPGALDATHQQATESATGAAPQPAIATGHTKDNATAPTIPASTLAPTAPPPATALPTTNAAADNNDNTVLTLGGRAAGSATSKHMTLGGGVAVLAGGTCTFGLTKPGAGRDGGSAFGHVGQHSCWHVHDLPLAYVSQPYRGSAFHLHMPPAGL
jgi:hypothetical protein